MKHIYFVAKQCKQIYSIHQWRFSLYRNPQVPLFASGFFSSFLLCSQHVPFKSPMGSHQAPKMFPRFPMCSPSVFSILWIYTCHIYISKKSALDPNTRTKMVLQKLIPTQYNNGSLPPCFEPPPHHYHHHHHHHSSSKEAMHRISLGCPHYNFGFQIHVFYTKHKVYSFHSQKSTKKLTSNNMSPTCDDIHNITWSLFLPRDCLL